jgi:4-hydroxy-tetrahydrodipicolinate synthase
MCEDGRVDFECWDRLLDFHAREGTDGVVVAGTTGESPTLERGELEALVARAKARIGARMPVIAGSGSASTAHGIALSRAAEAAGADGLLVVTPYYKTGRPRRGCTGISWRSPTRWACDPALQRPGPHGL